jgi:hypothetical protein
MGRLRVSLLDVMTGDIRVCSAGAVNGSEK